MSHPTVASMAVVVGHSRGGAGLISLSMHRPVTSTQTTPAVVDAGCVACVGHELGVGVAAMLTILLLFLSILWPKMANQDIHMVLTVCGITDQAIRQQIIDNEGFTALRDFGEIWKEILT